MYLPSPLGGCVHVCARVSEQKSEEIGRGSKRVSVCELSPNAALEIEQGCVVCAGYPVQLGHPLGRLVVSLPIGECASRHLLG